MDFIIRIANTNILIHSVYTSVYKVCKDYLIDENMQPDVELFSSDEMIYFELDQIQKAGQPVSSLSGIESLLVYRMIAESLLDRDILLMHGAVIATGDTSYMFAGRSGTGKTTHIQKWIENDDSSYIVNGDKPLVIINHHGAFACGTPWCGKEGFGKNTVVPLRSIVFMERNPMNSIEEASFKDVFINLLEQTYQPTDAGKMKKTLELLKMLKNQVSFYRFYFNNYKQDAFHTSFDTLTNQKPVREA